MKKDALIIVRGAGDLATGTIHRLWAAGFRVLALEAEHPAAIRRQVALSEVVYEGRVTVEGMTGVLVENSEQMQQAWDAGEVPVLVDPKGESICQLKPQIVVDAIIAKKNIGTNRKMAELTVALGPGFTAGEDVDIVIETKRPQSRPHHKKRTGSTKHRNSGKYRRLREGTCYTCRCTGNPKKCAQDWRYCYAGRRNCLYSDIFRTSSCICDHHGNYTWTDP